MKSKSYYSTTIYLFKGLYLLAANRIVTLSHGQQESEDQLLDILVRNSEAVRHAHNRLKKIGKQG